MTIPRMALKVGDKVWVGESWGWNDQKYTSGVVSKITPTGRITVTRKGSQEYNTVFRPDGRELGSSFRHGQWLDDQMSYEDREAYNQERERIDKAAGAIKAIMPANDHFRTKESIECEWNRLKSLFDAAKALVEAI